MIVILILMPRECIWLIACSACPCRLQLRLQCHSTGAHKFSCYHYLVRRLILLCDASGRSATEAEDSCNGLPLLCAAAHDAERCCFNPLKSPPPDPSALEPHCSKAAQLPAAQCMRPVTEPHASERHDPGLYRVLPGAHRLPSSHARLSPGPLAYLHLLEAQRRLVNLRVPFSATVNSLLWFLRGSVLVNTGTALDVQSVRAAQVFGARTLRVNIAGAAPQHVPSSCNSAATMRRASLGVCRMYWGRAVGSLPRLSTSSDVVHPHPVASL